jgi:hypothetical protein
MEVTGTLSARVRGQYMGQEVVQFRHAEKENIENGPSDVQCHPNSLLRSGNQLSKNALLIKNKDTTMSLPKRVSTKTILFFYNIHLRMRNTTLGLFLHLSLSCPHIAPTLNDSIALKNLCIVNFSRASHKLRQISCVYPSFFKSILITSTFKCLH